MLPPGSAVPRVPQARSGQTRGFRSQSPGRADEGQIGRAIFHFLAQPARCGRESWRCGRSSTSGVAHPCSVWSVPAAQPSARELGSRTFDVGTSVPLVPQWQIVECSTAAGNRATPTCQNILTGSCPQGNLMAKKKRIYNGDSTLLTRSGTQSGRHRPPGRRGRIVASGTRSRILHPACAFPAQPLHRRAHALYWTINPYRGCEFACKYCYARYTHEFMEMRDGVDFEQKIYVKQHAADLLRQELRRVKPGEQIAHRDRHRSLSARRAPLRSDSRHPGRIRPARGARIWASSPRAT